MGGAVVVVYMSVVDREVSFNTHCTVPVVQKSLSSP